MGRREGGSGEGGKRDVVAEGVNSSPVTTIQSLSQAVIRMDGGL